MHVHGSAGVPYMVIAGIEHQLRSRETASSFLLNDAHMSVCERANEIRSATILWLATSTSELIRVFM